MRIEETSREERVRLQQQQTPAPARTEGGRFPAVLEKGIAKYLRKNEPPQNPAAEDADVPSSSVPAPSPGKILLGTLSRETPTVQKLLARHPELSKETFRLIGQEVNRGKSFRNILPGTEIFLDRQTGELSWGTDQDVKKTAQPHFVHIPKGKILTSKPIVTKTNAAGGPPLPVTQAVPETAPAHPLADLTKVGTISAERRTVGDLLLANPELYNDRWRIVHDAANKAKPFHRIQENTTIYLHRDSRELFWEGAGLSTADAQALLAREGGKSSPAAESSPSAGLPVPSDTAHQGRVLLGRLSRATPTISELMKRHPLYEQNCWKIILSDQNRNKQFNAIRPDTAVYIDPQTLEISWDGMERSVTAPAAVDTGRGTAPAASGAPLASAKVFEKSLLPEGDLRQSANALFKEMTPHLENGLVLNISTPSTERAGVVSREGSTWTFAAAGMENGGGRPGAEAGNPGALLASLEGLLRQAADRNEPVRLTLGRAGGGKAGADTGIPQAPLFSRSGGTP